MSSAQRTRLAERIADKFKAPSSEVRAQMDREGFVIRATDVIVAYSARAFL